MRPSERLIETIKQQGIKPTPRWRFVLNNTLTWFFFSIGVLLGALAFSIILFAIQQTDFNIIGHLQHSKLEFFLSLLPIVWIIVLLIFVGLGMYAIQHAPKGYKLTLARRAGYSAVFSALLGALFFIAGGAQWLENAFAANVSVYESVQEKKVKLWMMPENGYLGGEISQISPNELTLVDFNNHTWTIYLNDSTFIAPVIDLEKGEKIKLIGKMLNDHQFNADEVRPWGGRRRGRQNN